MKQKFESKINLSLERDIIPILIEKKQIKGNIINCPFIDIGIPSDYKKAEKFMKDNWNV